MKLKIRIDSHDLMLIGILSLVLLYAVAVVVSNIATFAASGQLSGFNPFPAFGKDYIISTIVLFLIALAAVFFSVKSYIFDFDKGVGITTKKKDKGYSRWAKEKEIKEELELVNVKSNRSKAAGIPLILKENEMWVDNGEYHSLIIGATGSGKTQCVVFPLVNSLAKGRESMIITDPKGEIYEATGNMLRKKGYQVLLLNFRDPQKGSAWNPLTMPYRMYKSGNQDKAIELLDDLALNILYDESNKNADPFWEKTSADYFSGIALGLFEDAKEEEININSISLMTTEGEDKFGGSTYIQEYFGLKDPSSPAVIDASATITAPTETKGSILSVFRQKIKLFASRENLSEMLSHSSVNLESIGERPTAVFIIIQDEKKTYHSLVTILLKQIYETLIRTAQKHGGKLPVRTNFILDEFANMPPLKDVTTMITAARSRLIRFTMIIQNFAQLDSVYGKEDAETIKGNCGNIVYLITTELKALEEISKMCGEEKSKKDDKTASTPLVTVSDLQRMKLFDAIVLRMRKQPFKTSLTPNFKIDWGNKYPESKYPTRAKRPVQVFRIKEFVKDQKKKKLLEMMNADNDNNSTDSPFTLERPYKEDSMLPRGKGMMANNGRNMPSANLNNKQGLPISQEMNFNKEPPLPDFYEYKPTKKEEPTKPIKEDISEDDFDFDVDDLVKKIDAKIAKLEAEEKDQEEKDQEEPKISSAKIEGSQEVPTKDNVQVPKPPEKEEPKVTVNQEIPNNNVPLQTSQPTNLILDNNDDDDDDDDFFDDFFDN